jgi:superfamily II DNA or RNA helicase
MVNHTPYKIHISKLNDTYLVIQCDNDGVLMEMSSFFEFDVPGAKFMPQYKSRVWDGKIRLFDRRSGKIYFGLIKYILDFCERNELSVVLDPQVSRKKDIDRETIEGFIKSLKPKSRGKDLEIRDYQLDAVHHAIQNNRALFLSPTASGKSLIIYAIIRYYTLLLQKQENSKILILVPTTSLVEQMYSDFIDYGWDDKYIHRIYQGHSKDTNKPIVISTWQSIYKLHKSYFKQFGCIVGDEAHLFKAKSLTGILTKLENCKYKFGLTGTLDGTQTHRLVLEGLFGQVEKVTTTKKLMEKETVADLEIKCIVLKHKEEEAKQIRDFKYSEEIDYLVQHQKRNDFITKLCNTLNGNTLCLFQLVEKHGKVLYNMLKENTDKHIYFVFGGTDTETREKIREITEQQSNTIIVASYGTFSTGINIRNLHNIVFASPSKSRVRVLQSIGRGLRKADNKVSVRVLDIADDLTYNEKKNFTLNHFLERINIYAEEEFDYEINNIKL